MQAWSATKPKDRSILCVGRALRHKGHIPGDGGNRARSRFAARMERPLRSAPTQWPQTRNRKPFRRFAMRLKVSTKPDQGRFLERSLWRGQVGVGKAPRSEWCATTGPRPFGRTALEALASSAGADHLRAERPGGDLWPVRGDGRAERRRWRLRRRLANCWMRPSDAPRIRPRRTHSPRRGAVRYPSHRAADGRIHRGLCWTGARRSPVISTRTSGHRLLGEVALAPNLSCLLSRAGGKAVAP